MNDATNHGTGHNPLSQRGFALFFACSLPLRLGVTLLALIYGISPAPCRAAEPAATFSTAADLWRGFDPTALPLDVEIVRSWEEGDLAFQALRFTGEIGPPEAGAADWRPRDGQPGEGVPVRVYAIQGAPRSAVRPPGVLHIHGGGQTASLDWVRFWAGRGYVSVTFDFCGPWAERDEVTQWGTIPHANMAQAAGGFQLRPTPRESSWNHWTLVSRRALSLLAAHPQVDPARLGVFGISVGGTLTWLVAGTDARVTAAAPIFGCGYNYDRRNAAWDILAASPDYNEFQRFLSPEAYATRIHCPLLFLSASNDFHGLLDRAYEALDSTAGPTWQAISPRTDHHIEPAAGRNLPLWMDWHLRGGSAWPATPEVEIHVDTEGVPFATVIPDRSDEVAEVSVYYALGNERPQVRYWRAAALSDEPPKTLAALPVWDPWDELRVFANVSYRDGPCLTSSLVRVIPGQLGEAKGTLVRQTRLASDVDGLAHWKFLGGYTDPVVDWTHLRLGSDPDFGPTVGFQTEHLGDPVPVQLYTHLVGDPQYQGAASEALAFRVRGEFTADGLVITAIVGDHSLHARSYQARVAATDLPGSWQQIVLPLGRFAASSGEPLPAWSAVDRLELRGKATAASQPEFADWQWVPAD